MRKTNSNHCAIPARSIRGVARTMKTSRIDWAKFISEEAKVSPLLKSDEIARRPGMSELVVRRSFLRLAKRGMIEHFAKKWFINLFARDFSGGELVNLLRPRSYVSLQTVLRKAGIRSQTPVSITGVTTGEPESFSSGTVSITFRHIKPSLYWGFQARRTFYGTYNVCRTGEGTVGLVLPGAKAGELSPSPTSSTSAS